VTDLAKDSSIDPNRIHVIGWSFGWGASFSALALAERESVKINSVVAFFPYCKGALAWKQPTPVLKLVGLADNIAPFAQCKDLVKDGAIGRRASYTGSPRGRPESAHGHHPIASAKQASPPEDPPRIEAAFTRIASAIHASGIPALRRPSYVRSFVSRRGGPPPCAEK
jgi:dienelactone hydrolase